MSVSKEIQEKIKFLFKSNPEMIEKLYRYDADAIREIASLSYKGINPEDVIVAYESGDPISMDYLYQQAKRLVGLKELYKKLYIEYYKNIKDASKHTECDNVIKKRVKK